MRIGIDLDNTIVAYDQVFLLLAKQWRLVPAHFHGAKKVLRDLIRREPGGDYQWQRLQGQVYGKLMNKARLFPGVSDFLLNCKSHAVSVYIVSHKTEYGHYDPAKTSLRQAAWQWMENHGFFLKEKFYIDRNQVFFNDTRDAKLATIRQLRCDVFIDDLAEIFADPGFPSNVKSILFDPEKTAEQSAVCQIYNDWYEINSALWANAG